MKRLGKTAFHIFEQLRPTRPRKSAEQAISRGDVTGEVLDVIRHADVPMTASEIAKRLLVMRGLHRDEPSFVRMMTKRVDTCLKAKQRQGILEVAGEWEGDQTWKVTP